jgi:ABC-type transport system involved in multi-copper enzyme maturation permease subunit
MRRRWMPWIMVGLVVVLVFFLYLVFWASIRAQIEAMRSGQIPAPPGAVAQAEQSLREVQPDRVQNFGIAIVTQLGVIMLIVFAASHVGTEFGWGTLRTLLAHDASRGAILLSKFVSLVLFAAILFGVGAAAAILASFTVAAIGGSAGGSVDLGLVATRAGKSAYACLPYVTLSVLLGVLARSAGAGIAGGLVVFFAESIVAGILVQLNRDYANVVNWGINRNFASLTNASVSTDGAAAAAAAATLPSQGQAAGVLAIYAIVFLAIAYWRLRSRDVTIGG